mgnify:CR=1 FL=1
MGEKREIEEIFSKAVRAGRRTYFFDVRSTRAGDYYLTMTESKRDFNEDGTPFYRKHKIYLYKEDFVNFKEALAELTDYIIKEKGEEIISLNKTEIKEKKVAEKEKEEAETQTEDTSETKEEKETKEESNTDFTEVSFDDLGEEGSEENEEETTEEKQED